MLAIQPVANTHPALLGLCVQLDEYLNRLAGGEEKRRQYIPFNQAEDLCAAFLVRDDEVAIGCAGLKEIDAATGEIKRVFVVPHARSKGAGSLLMEALEKEAVKRGYSQLVLETGASLEEATRLYKRYDYSIIPAYGQYAKMEDMGDSICMGKALTKSVSQSLP